MFVVSNLHPSMLQSYHQHPHNMCTYHFYRMIHVHCNHLDNLRTHWLLITPTLEQEGLAFLFDGLQTNKFDSSSIQLKIRKSILYNLFDKMRWSKKERMNEEITTTAMNLMWFFFFFMRKKKTFRSVFSNQRKFPHKIPTVVQVPATTIFESFIY